MYVSRSSLFCVEMAGGGRRPGEIQRRRILVQGTVRGVGFRPFVYQLAQRYALAGFVRQERTGVIIEVEGKVTSLGSFMEALSQEAPTLARIELFHTQSLVTHGDAGFVIAHSQQVVRERRALHSAALSPCPDCLRELFDADDRRYRYAGIHCQQCGPERFVLDRERAEAGAAFGMCPACQREYDDPRGRRYRLRSNACPACGPRLSLEGPRQAGEPLSQAGQMLKAGATLALQGPGGYHLVCEAGNTAAVERMCRHRQAGDGLCAVLVPDLETAHLLCEISAEEEALVASRRRPIVLLRRRKGDGIASVVAAAATELGVVLPFTPVQYLLLHDYQGRLEECPAVLAITAVQQRGGSALHREREMRAFLASVADGILSYGRPPARFCADSLARITAHGPQYLRRSLGAVPESLPFAVGGATQILACGSDLANTFCLTRDRRAFLSPHLGHLRHPTAWQEYRSGIEYWQARLSCEPGVVAYDLAVGQLSSRYALGSSISHTLGIEHHEAHIASVMAEHGLAGPVIGIVADGVESVNADAPPGGEICIGHLQHFERRYSLAELPAFADEQAADAARGLGLACLLSAYGSEARALKIPFLRQLELEGQPSLLTRPSSGPASLARRISSLGQLCGAVAALLGLCRDAEEVSQGVVRLEREAGRAAAGWRSGEKADVGYPGSVDGQARRLDVMPLLRAIVSDLEKGVAIPLIAWGFHTALIRMLVLACERIRQEAGLETVVLGGDVFQNRLLLELLTRWLEENGFQVYFNQRVPPNDGGLSLGQAAIAAARLSGRLGEIRGEVRWWQSQLSLLIFPAPVVLWGSYF